MRDLLVMLKNWTDIIGVAVGMALAVYGLLNLGILAMTIIGVASIVFGTVLRMALKTMGKKRKKDGNIGV